jgi:hypothetical protein
MTCRSLRIASLGASLLACVLVAALTAPAARALDGRYELSHLCATVTGCVQGDAPGYPITLTLPATAGYVLTSELVVPDANTSAIVISTNDVHIDMNGFRIVRAGCENATATCAPASGTGDGIGVDDFTLRRGASVSNGNVVGMGRYGLALGPQARVTHVQARWNRLTGIALNEDGRVHRVRSIENGGNGISVLSGSTVSESATVGNGDAGIFTSTGCHVVRNVAWGNGEQGIRSTTGSVVRHNAVGDNGSLAGIQAAASTVAGNAVSGQSGGPGILATTGSMVESNAVSDTALGHEGLELGDAGYRGNVLTNNPSGHVTGGINLGANACGGFLCP